MESWKVFNAISAIFLLRIYNCKNQISAFCNSLFLEIIFLRFTTIQVYGIIKICNAKHFIRNIIGLVN